MMNIFDYIFYRIYKRYTKTDNYPSKFASSLFMFVMFFFLMASIFGIIHNYLIDSDNEIINKFVYVLYGIAVFSFTFRRYYNQKKINKLKKKYSVNNLNEKIPDFIIFLALPISMIFGIFIYYLLSNFLFG